MKHVAILKQYLIYQKNSPPKNDTKRDVVIMKCAKNRNYQNYNSPTKNTKWKKRSYEEKKLQIMLAK